MGIRYQTATEDFVYTVVDDLQSTYAALITSGLVDEVWGTPLQVEAVITSDIAATGINLGDGALFAVTGYASQVFPQLATTPYTVNLEVVAPGYRTAGVAIHVPAGTTLPFVFAPIKMRPLPVRLQGRVVKDSDRSPIAAATIASGDNTVLLLRSPLYFDHAAGVTINTYTFTAVGGALTLASPVTGGSNMIFLSSTAGIGPTQTLQIGTDPLTELAIIQSIGPLPGQVNLFNSLNSSFPQNSNVQPMNPVGPGASATLQRGSNARDGLVVLSAGLSGTAIQVSDGAQSEFHLINPVADGSGYYHCDGLTGVESVDLQAIAGGFTTGTATWFIVYSDPVNVVDFRLKP